MVHHGECITANMSSLVCLCGNSVQCCVRAFMYRLSYYGLWLPDTNKD